MPLTFILYICLSLFGLSTLFVASLVFTKGTSYRVIRRNFSRVVACSRVSVVGDERKQRQREKMSILRLECRNYTLFLTTMGEMC